MKFDINNLCGAWTIFLWQEQFSCARNNILTTGEENNLWQEQFSCDRKFIPVTLFYNLVRNCLWKEIFLVTVTIFLWQEHFSCNRNNFLVPGTIFLQQEQFFCDWNNFLLTWTIFFWQEQFSCDRNKFLVTWHLFLWKASQEFQQRFRLRFSDFMWTWSPGWPWLSHPG